MFQIASTPKGEKSVVPEENATDIVFPGVKNRTSFYISSIFIDRAKVIAKAAMISDGDTLPAPEALVNVIVKVRHEGELFAPTTPPSTDDASLMVQLNALLGDSYIKISRSGRFMSAKPTKAGNAEKRTPLGSSSQKKLSDC